MLFRSRAIEEMHERGLAEVTQVYDLMDRRSVPTTKYVGIAKTVTNLMGALFHHVERLNREVMYLTSFRLSFDEAKRRGLSDEEAFAVAVDQAVNDTYTALGNFTAQNRPRILRHPTGRVFGQFKMFPAFVTTYFIRNAYRMTAGMDKETKKEAAIQLFGTLTMSFALAGYVGIPGISFAFGVAQGLRNLFSHGDDDDPIEKRDLETWFRTVYLPNLFGDVKIGDRKLGEILEGGLLNTMTGLDISSSLSMNNLWFPDLKESPTATAAIQDYIMSMIGPSVSLFAKQLPGAYDDFAKGKTLQGMEKALPALFARPVTAYRYSQEGARTKANDIIKDKDEFTKGQLAAQFFGFRTQGLASAQEANFKAEGLRQQVMQEKRKLLDRFELEAESGSDDAFDKALDKILDFNSKNPTLKVESKDLTAMIKKRAEIHAKSDRGFRVDKNLYPYLVDLLDVSRERIEREAARK